MLIFWVLEGLCHLLSRLNAVYVVRRLYNVSETVQRTCNNESNLKLHFYSCPNGLLYRMSHSYSLHRGAQQIFGKWKVYVE